MRSFRFSARTSFALGSLLALVVVITMGQMTAKPFPIANLRVEYAPNPWTAVVIRQGTPYTVPAGKIFVLTALGQVVAGDVTHRVTLYADGAQIYEILPELQHDQNGFVNDDAIASIKPAPLGITAQSGVVLSVATTALGVAARAWGYLEDASPGSEPRTLRVSYTPPARDLVQVIGGAPYTVPPSKSFVLTSVGRAIALPGDVVQLAVNGVQELAAYEGLAASHPHHASLAPCLVVPAGSVITMSHSSGQPTDCRAWGYLIDP